MFFRSFGVIGITLFSIGCATTIPVTPECEPVCQLETVCADTESCEALLVQVGGEEFCQDVDVEVTREVCNTFLDTVTTCSDSEVAYAAVVTGQTTVSHTDTDCSVSNVTHSEVVVGTTSFSYSQLDCEEDDVEHSDTVCGDGSYTYTDTDCVDDTVTQSGDVCETSSVTRHRTVDFETAADGSLISSGAWGDDVGLAYQDWGLAISVTDYDGSASSTDIATFDTLAPTGGDSDLGTMNDYWGGPGVGSGGFDTNFFERGNALIHAEDLGDSDGNGLLDDPDDNASGAQFSFDFVDTVCVERLTLVDVEPNENGYLKMYDDSGVEIFSQQIIGLGDNSIQIVDPNVCGVGQVVFEMCGSGALDDLQFSYEESVETCLDYEDTCLTQDCTDTDKTETLEVCTVHDYTCSETECEETAVTEDVTTETDFAYTCAETTCQDTVVSQTVTTSSNYSYTCDETQCVDEQVKVEVCQTQTFVETVEVCTEVPTYEAELSCDETCEEVEVCDDSVCNSDDKNDDEWLSGGGFPGAK